MKLIYILMYRYVGEFEWIIEKVLTSMERAKEEMEAYEKCDKAAYISYTEYKIQTEALED